MLLFIIAFLAGILTILAPCVLPLLPVIVGGSISGERNMRRATVVIFSLALSLIAFTFLLKLSTVFINIPQSVWAYISGGLILIFGLITLFPELFDRIGVVAGINRNANSMLATGFKKKTFWGDVIIGAALGPVFSTCSPTYFVIVALAVSQSIVLGMVYLLAYVAGLCAVLFLVAFIGQRIVDRLGGAADPRGWFKRILGIIFVLLGIAIMFGIDKQIEKNILSSGVFDVTTIEQKLLKYRESESRKENMDDNIKNDSLIINDTEMIKNGSTTKDDSMMKNSGVKNDNTVTAPHFMTTAQKSLRYSKFTELTGIKGYINTNNLPITIGQYVGKKVILIDFWTYSCINCQRTLPYVNGWYDTYEKDGLVIIGIHTPEFAFEKVQKNVEDAVARLGIKYPVVLDNDYATWNAFGNQYWPRKYLIDIDGYVVYDHIGEGDYDITETAIQKALTERATRIGQSDVLKNVQGTTMLQPKDIMMTDGSKLGSPETYFGAFRNTYLANGTQNKIGIQQFTLPVNMRSNNLYLNGSWNIFKEYAESIASAENSSDNTVAKIVYQYTAKDVYFVAASDLGADIEVWQDGAKISNEAGADVSKNGIMTVKEDRLYKVVHNSDYGTHTLELRVMKGVLKAFTFTFG